MNTLTIITNNIPRQLLSGYELTDKERLELDYVANPNDIEKWNDATNRFFRYKNQIYDIHEFVRLVPMNSIDHPFSHRFEPNSPLANWHAIQTDSFFSAVVIRYADDDYETVIVGLAIS